MRLIDADALVAKLQREAQAIRKNHPDRTGKIMSATCMAIAEVIMMSEETPVEELEPVRHGRWVNPHMNKYGHPCHHCSECGFLESQKDRYFCPNCGAKMDGGKSDA
jgi:uncharacterized paraquat-inducible protein A